MLCLYPGVTRIVVKDVVGLDRLAHTKPSQGACCRAAHDKIQKIRVYSRDNSKSNVGALAIVDTVPTLTCIYQGWHGVPLRFSKLLDDMSQPEGLHSSRTVKVDIGLDLGFRALVELRAAV